MAVDERGVGGQGGPIVDAVVKPRTVHMAVGKEERLVAGGGIHKDVVVGHAGKVEDHLVDLGLAVASHGDDAVGDAVEHLDHALGRVVGGQVVAGAVVQEVAEEHHPIGLLGLDGGHEALAPIGGAMDVGRDDEFHWL